MSFASKLLKCSVDIERILKNDHIDNQPQRSVLIFLALAVSLPQFTLFTMKHRASQFVTILAFIELIQNSSTFGLVIDVVKGVNCLVDPPDLGHSMSQLRWSITDLKRSHDRGSLNHAELERSRQAEKVVPVLRDQFRVNPVTSNAI